MGSEPIAETPWRRLHPLSLAVNLVPQAWRVLKGYWPVLLFMLLPRQGSSGGSGGADPLFFFIFVGLSLLSTVTHYFTLRYRMHDGRLEIQSGLLNRSARSIDPARIQNIGLVQNLFHKMSGLVELRVETAGDGGAEGLLSALSLDEAEGLRAALEAGRGRVVTTETEDAPVILENSALELLGFGLSQRRMGAVALFTAVAMELSTTLDPERFGQLAGSLGALTMLAFLLLAFAASWAMSAGSSLLRHWGFRLLRQGDRLVTEEGLTTRRRVEIPLSKVQLVTAEEPLLRRVMGYATLSMETAAISFDEGRARQAEATLPMVPTGQLGAVLAAAAPRVGVDPWTATLERPHPRALGRALVRALLRGCFYSVGLAAVFWTVLSWWGLALPLVLLPWMALTATLDWKRQGWMVTKEAVIARRGFLLRRTQVLSRDKVQSVAMVQGPLLKLNKLAVIDVRVAGGSQVRLPEIGEDQARVVFELLSGPAEREAEGGAGALHRPVVRDINAPPPSRR